MVIQILETPILTQHMSVGGQHGSTTA